MLMLGLLDAVLMKIAKLWSKPLLSPVSVMLSATHLVTVVMTSLSLSAIRRTVNRYNYMYIYVMHGMYTIC